MRCGWNKKSIPSACGSRRGFTMIEILVVVVIAALVAAIALPGFVRSMRGAQLRTASRTVLMSHKYARSTAVLRQVPMAILIDKEHSELEIIEMRSASGSSERDKFLDARQNRDVDAALGAAAPAEEQKAAPAITTDVFRELGRDVKIESFQSERGGQEYRGVFWIMYHPNGMSDGFELELSDGSNRRATITSDAISGKVAAKFSDF